jgi:Ca-activated chloride channel family protein
MTSLGLPGLLRFEHATYLLALGLLPVLLLLSLRSLAGLGPVRRRLAIAMRCIVVACLVLALAGPLRVRTTDDQTAVFLLDQSLSVPRAQQQAAFDFVRRAAEGMRNGKDRVALVTFDGAPLVEQLPRPALTVDHLASGAQPHHTNLSGALRMALALFPPDTARRVVVLSDGNENVGQALLEADTYLAAGVPIDVAPLTYQHDAEILVERLTAPASAALDQTVDLNLVVRSQKAGKARILLYHDDVLIDYDPSPMEAGFPVTLEPGYNRFPIPVQLRHAGAHRFRAVVVPESADMDTIAANNEGRAFTLVAGEQRVLILTEVLDAESADTLSAHRLAQALRQSSIQCDVAGLGEVSLEPAALTGYSLVILSNVSAISLGEARQLALASYVRDLGGGLIAVGGDKAFSVGGYFRTALEEILPVVTDRAKLQFLSLSMVIVIDRSGSMSGQKIEMTREAAIGSVQLLNRTDHIGVIAFDSQPEWIVPLVRCEDKPRIVARIAEIGAGGGTSIYPALEQAYAALAPAETNLKHAIVITDGQSSPGAFDEIAADFKKSGITISTVAVGDDADTELLNRLARISGGRMYIAESAKPLPQIFARETVLASRSGIYERTFSPLLRVSADEQVLRGLGQADIPPLDGYVVTAAKPLASVPLVRASESSTDPILAYWQAGLGRSLAFTSGLWPRWGSSWLSWPGFTRVWAQAVRWAARPAQSTDFNVVATLEGDRAKIALDARDLPAHLLGSISMAGRVVDPNFDAHPLQPLQVGPGRFEASFPAGEPGAYLVSLAYQAGTESAGRSGLIQTGVVVTYSPELATVAPDHALLTELAQRTRGRQMDLADAARVFDPALVSPVEARRPIWEDLVRLALIAFLIDVAVRRIAFRPREAAQHIRKRIRELAGAPVSVTATRTVAVLRGAREDVREGLRGGAVNPAASSRGTVPLPDGAATDVESVDPLSRAIRTAGAMDKPVVADPKATGPAAAESYAARLKRAKREARAQHEDDARAG